MKPEQLLQAIGDVDEKALARSEKKILPFKKWLKPAGLAAACLCLCVIGIGAGSILLGSSSKYAMDAADTSSSYGYINKTEAIWNEAESPMWDESDMSYNSASGIHSTGSMKPTDTESSDSVSQSADISRKLITTMNIDLEAEDYDSCILWIEKQTTSLGGYIQNADSYTDYSKRHHASYTLRIPAATLDSFVNGLGGVGNLRSSSTETQDVTLTYSDLQSHVDALRIEQERLLALLEQADTLADMLEIEDRLTYVRYELESYASRLLVYDNQINYSTIRLSVSEVVTYTAPEPETIGDRIRSGFKDNLDSLREAGEDILVFFLANSPSLIVLAVIVTIIIMVIRKIVHRKKKL